MKSNSLVRCAVFSLLSTFCVSALAQYPINDNLRLNPSATGQSTTLELLGPSYNPADPNAVRGLTQ